MLSISVTVVNHFLECNRKDNNQHLSRLTPISYKTAVLVQWYYLYNNDLTYLPEKPDTQIDVSVAGNYISANV